MIWEFHFSFWLMKDADLDGESFIEMDLPGVNTLTAEVKLKKRLSRNCQDLRGRNGEYFFFVLSLCCKRNSELLSNGHGLATVDKDSGIDHYVDGSLAFQILIIIHV